MTMLPPPSAKKLGLVIDLDTCVGCHACAVACKEWDSGGVAGPLIGKILVAFCLSQTIGQISHEFRSFLAICLLTLQVVAAPLLATGVWFYCQRFLTVSVLVAAASPPAAGGAAHPL